MVDLKPGEYDPSDYEYPPTGWAGWYPLFATKVSPQGDVTVSVENMPDEFEISNFLWDNPAETFMEVNGNTVTFHLEEGDFTYRRVGRAGPNSWWVKRV